jgi:hypothetical protein
MWPSPTLIKLNYLHKNNKVTNDGWRKQDKGMYKIKKKKYLKDSQNLRSACPYVYQLPSQHIQTDFQSQKWAQII